MKTEKQIIHYLSSLPGVGKTRWATRLMRHHLKKGRGLIFYVAPTIDLLEEVRSILREGLDREHRKKIVFAVSSFQVSVREKVSEVLRDKIESGSDFSLADGSIVLMTHEGFLRLPQNLPRKDETLVIFDEARKLTAQLNPIHLANERERKMFRDLVAKNSSVVYGPSGEETPFRHFILSEWPKEIKEISHSSRSREHYASLREVISSAMNLRTDLYVRMKERKHWSDASDKWINFYEVTVPSRVFEGFREVILMAAFLEDSQMWHFLAASRRVRLVPLSEHPRYGRTLKSFHERMHRILERFSRVCLFPLSNQSTPLSMTRLVNGIMVPEKDYLEVKSALEEFGLQKTAVVKEVLMDRAARPPKPGTPERRALRVLRDAGAVGDPFSWYMRSAKKFIEVLKEEGKVEGKTLVVVNDRNIQKLERKHPSLKRISTVSNGLNKYKKSNTLIFAAAINPDPKVAALYRTILKDYDYVKDHLADSCVQSVTRLCVRDTQSDVVAYVILPDTAMAEILREKMLRIPPISSRALFTGTPCVALTTFNLERKRKPKTDTEKLSLKEKRKLTERNRLKKKRSSPIERQLNSKITLRSRYRKLNEEKPTRELAKKLAAIDQEILALRERKKIA